MSDHICLREVVHTSLGDIEYCSAGKGIPVLFIHGGHSNCNDTLCHKGFDPDRYQLITPSRPGYGATPLGDNKTPRQAAELIAELIRYLSLSQVIIYGVSAGGLTAIEFASCFPGITRKLVLASAVTKEWLDKNGKTYKAAKILFGPSLQGFTWAMIRFMGKAFPGMIAKNFYRQFSKVAHHRLRKEDRLALIAALNKYSSKDGFINDINQKGVNGAFANVKCPTLIIHSEHDNSVPVEHALFAGQLIKDARIEVLQNEWGHLFWIGADSDRSIEKTVQFIEE